MRRIADIKKHVLWLAKATSQSQKSMEDARLLKEIRRIHGQSDRTYGSPRMGADHLPSLLIGLSD